MKLIEVKPGIIVSSPWYNIAEASAHSGLARSTFTEKSIEGGLPSHGDVNNKRYYVEELDRWIANGFRYPETVAASKTI